jgi:hypothetical protein
MELTGMALAQTARMRERTLPSNPLLVTPGPSAEARALSAGNPLAEEVKPAQEPADALDKYDISLIACTD